MCQPGHCSWRSSHVGWCGLPAAAEETMTRSQRTRQTTEEESTAQRDDPAANIVTPPEGEAASASDPSRNAHATERLESKRLPAVREDLGRWRRKHPADLLEVVHNESKHHRQTASGNSTLDGITKCTTTSASMTAGIRTGKCWWPRGTNQITCNAYRLRASPQRPIRLTTFNRF